MTLSKKAAYDKAAFLTVFQFSKKHNITKDDKTALSDAATMLYKQRVTVKNPAGNLVPAVMRSRTSHHTTQLIINPLAHAIVLKEIENQKKLETKRSKGASK